MKYAYLLTLLGVLVAAPALAEQCKSSNNLQLCACKGACVASSNSCKCKDADDPGAGGLLCTPLKLQSPRMTCQIGCERSKSNAKCNPS
jgi:hypothetical protein